MKKKCFDPALYLDALRQLKIVGVVYLVIVELAAVLTCIFYSLNYTAQSYRPTYSLMEASPILLPTVLAFASIMTLMLFYFLNKRSACDVIHALPNRRTSLFFSYVSAILTWLIAGVLISVLTSTVGFLVTVDNVFFSVASIPVTLFYYLCVCLFMTAVVMLAMSVTGTLFSNLAVTALIALAPRLLMLVFTTSLQSMLPILPDQALPEIIQVQNNPIVFAAFRLFSSDALPTWFQVVYVLIVSAIYMAAAAFLFRGRHSEIADQSAPNPVLQAVFRLTFAMLICLIPCMLILDNISRGYGFADDTSTLFSYIILYIIAVVGYFLYELVTTRKVHNLVRAIPVLGILVLLNVAFIGDTVVMRNLTLSDTPDAEDIVSVKFLELYGPNNTGFYDDSKRLQKFELKDAEIRQQIAENLKANVNEIKRDRYYTESSTCVVSIQLRGRTIVRQLKISDTDILALMQRLYDMDDFRQSFQELPSFSKANVNFSYNTAQLSNEKIAPIYDTLRAEVKELDFIAWIDYLSHGSQSNSNSPYWNKYTYLPESLSIYKAEGNTWGGSVIPFSSLIPKTSNAYMNAANQGSRDAVVDNMQRLDHNTDTFMIKGFGFAGVKSDMNTVGFTFGLKNSGYGAEYETAMRNLFTQITALCVRKQNEPVDITTPIWMIYDTNANQYLYVNADSAQLPENLPESVMNPSDDSTVLTTTTVYTPHTYVYDVSSTGN